MSLTTIGSVKAADFYNNVNNGDWKIYAIMAVTSSGTEVVITDKSGRQWVVKITDRLSLGAAAILDGALGVLQATVKTGTPLAGDPGLVVNLKASTNQVITLAGGQSIQVGQGITDSSVAGGAVLGPAAGTTIATLLTGGGKVDVWINTDLGPTAVEIDIGNMQLVSALATFTLPRGLIGPIHYTSSTALTIKAIGAATGTATYVAIIAALPIP